ncbi:FAD:protein FMN transferase [Colwelliaceae bacterium 6441]
MSQGICRDRVVKCQPREGGFSLSFFSMASLCEVLVDTDNEELAKKLGNIAAQEAWRIEDKYSRYDQHSLCYQINKNAGQRVSIDDETYKLFEFAHQCYEMSDGAFDITSGILRKVWQFDGSDNIPNKQSVNSLLKFVGWDKVNYSPDSFCMANGMEIDFGGLGKEYAVDRTVLLLSQAANIPFLVNYGGDLAAYGARKGNEPWQIGIEHPSFKNNNDTIVTMTTGAIATSGDANRFLLKDGHRYSHILDVKTGWPVINPPNAITVAAPQCIQAGFLATLALLQGVKAESFLKQQDILYWSIR